MVLQRGMGCLIKDPSRHWKTCVHCSGRLVLLIDRDSSSDQPTHNVFTDTPDSGSDSQRTRDRQAASDAETFSNLTVEPKITE